MNDRMKENVIEWIEGDQTASCTFSQKRYINKIYQMVEKGEEGFEIIKVNKDGSIFCHVPLKAILISSKRNYSEEELQRRSEHMKAVRKSK